MKPSTAIITCISALLILAGALSWYRGHQLPPYESPDSWDGLIAATHNDSTAWYHWLRRIETPHKRLTDTGLSLIATGLSIPLLAGFLHWHRRANPEHRKIRLVGFSIALELVLIPSNYVYLFRRYKRGDYPPWADSIAIPIVEYTVAYLILAGLMATVTLLALRNRTCADRISVQMPRGGVDWLRFTFLSGLTLLFALGIPAALSSGDIGVPLSTLGSITLMLLLLSAQSPHHVATAQRLNGDQQALADLQAKLYARRTGIAPRQP
ncbi:hypothetical protein [Sulfuriroseicoccus oceanibius]|uniref:Uncharacterized protein n=1 Tax=Sulfuriroseicoccus oceanibius TaxID=2707525 RepID=A0A6B3L8M8_9BACT|nr:hypothetical protein [Sulfuriroseicoccus oceanibius]QQL46179.1 hypothetical protein G3M56_006250 [Sulfuriroseicoccus oceanibius]